MDSGSWTASLAAEIGNSWAPVLVEAVDGSSKRALALAVATRSGAQQLTMLSSPDWESRIAADEPVVIVEGNERANDLEVDIKLAAALSGRVSEQPCVLVATRFGPAVDGERKRQRLPHLTEADLWLDHDDIAQALAKNGIDEALSPMVHELTGGWPTLVWEAIDQVAAVGPAELHSILTLNLERRLTEALQKLSPQTISTLSQLSHLRQFDNEVALLLDDATALDEIVRAGIPQPPAGGGWREMPLVVRSWVRIHVDGPCHVPVKLLDHIAKRGQPIAAIESAIGASQHDDAALLISQLSLDQSLAIDPARLGAAFGRIGATMGDVPRAQLVRARVEFARGSVGRSVEFLRDGIARAPATNGDAALVGELNAELALMHYYAGDLDSARTVLEASPPIESPSGQARRLEVEAGLLALEGTDNSLAAAAAQYQRAAALWVEAGQPAAAALVGLRLGVEVTQKQGHLGDAAVLLRHAEEVSSSSPTSSVVRRLLRSRVHALAGYREDALEALSSARPIVTNSQIGMLKSYDENVLMILASHDGDLDEVCRRADAVRASSDLNDGTGALLLVDQVDAFVRCGSEADSVRCMKELRAHPAAEPADVNASSAMVACMFGDANDGIAEVQRCLASDLVVPRGNWRVQLAAAVAATRIGDIQSANEWLAQAKADTAARGTSGLLERTEARVITQLRSPGAPAPASPSTRAPCHVQLFDKFEVFVDGVPAPMPKGRPRTLLKLMILDGGIVSVDEAVDALWPGDDPERGRSRLRNNLTRLRASCGPVIEREQDVLRLVDSEISSDYGHWVGDMQLALNATEPNDDELAQLISRVPNHLLPEDQYAEWLQPRQRSWVTGLLRLIDRRIESALARNDTATALAMYHRALDVDPYTTERIDSAVELARARGLPDDAATFENRRP